MYRSFFSRLSYFILLFVFGTNLAHAADANLTEYQTHLQNLFTDLSCSELKSGITASLLPDNEDYLKLPTELQKMAMKIATGDWSETNQYKDATAQWESKYAKKYRVQMYEPYSEGSAAAAMAGISAYTNMNNPTGILGDKGDVIYVMVRDEIKDGATLYIREVADVGLHNSVKDEEEKIEGVGSIRGIKLNKGLNAITCQCDNAHFFIYYTVPTANKPSDSSRYQHVEKYKLSNYDPIKIHIEGGRINGFFNAAGDAFTDNGELLYTPDTQLDFIYTVTRATHPMYDLIGRYVILHFHLNDTPTANSSIKGVRSSLVTNPTAGTGREYDPVKIINAWDRMCMAERILMGLQSDTEIDEFNSTSGAKILGNPAATFYETIVGTNDKFQHGSTTYSLDPGYHYNDYFNNKLMGLSENRDGLFMSATAWRMNFHIDTVDEILTLFDNGDIWGPAHEYGHINQGPMNMAGTTEESNNIFSNVVLYFVGKNTSRSEFISKQLEVFLQDKPFLEHGTWGTTRMFWQLWCYYHAAGHNKKFYPRLYELLRNYPLQKVVYPGRHNLRYDWLQFAKMCCIAAGEDLTNFFTAWGFFEPLDSYFIGDYSSYDAYLTEADIAAVKEEIASFGFPMNDAIILIDDRPGVTDRKSYDGFPIANAGEFGGLGAFRSGVKPSGEFSFTVSLNTVTVTTNGNPGAGYIIKDATGNLLGFSNSNTFEVTDELAAKLRTGEAVITAVGADSDHTEANVTNTILSGDMQSQKAILLDLLAKTENLLKYVDDEYKKVGYFSPEAASPLKNYYEVAKAEAEKENSETPLAEVINKLSEAYSELLHNPDNYIGINMGDTYMLYNDARTPCMLSTDGNICTVVRSTDAVTDPLLQQWFFEPIGDGTYHMKNVSTGKYVSSAGITSSPVKLSSEEMIPISINPCRVEATNIGRFSVTPPKNSVGMHVTAQYTIIGWTASASASQWSITKVHDASDDEVSGKLRQMYADLLGKLLKGYQNLLENIDPLGVKVGYYKPEAENVIESLCEDIEQIMADKTLSLDQYRALYEENLAAYNECIAPNSPLKINIEPGAAYTLTNVSDRARILSTDETNVLTTDSYKFNEYRTQWALEQVKGEVGFIVRNLEAHKFIASPGLGNNVTLPLKDQAGAERFILKEVADAVGVHTVTAVEPGIGSMVMNTAGSEIRLITSYNALGQWTLQKIQDSEFVKYRVMLKYEIDRMSELLFSISYERWDLDLYMQWLDELEGATDVYNSINPDVESLRQAAEKLADFNDYCEAYFNGNDIIKAKVSAGFNDRIDDSASDVNRFAFNSEGTYVFEKWLSIEADFDTANIEVGVVPVSEEWQTTESDDPAQAYRDAFSDKGVDNNVFEQFEALDGAVVDGFWNARNASAKLIRNGNDEGLSLYDLVLTVPCSGEYIINVKPTQERTSFFDEDYKPVAPAYVHVYPNLKASTNGELGFNIEGFTFEDDGETISIPLSFIKKNTMTRCKAYIPGTYFADTFSVQIQSDTKTEQARVAKENKLSSLLGNGFTANLDLSALKGIEDEEDAPILPVTIKVVKNGADAVYHAYVTMHNDLPTGVESVITDDNLPEIYYDLRGMRISHPGPGAVYIVVRGGEAKKVYLR